MRMSDENNAIPQAEAANIELSIEVAGFENFV